MKLLVLICILTMFTFLNAQAQTCESLFEESKVLTNLTLEDQKVLTQFARKQVEVSINYSISREQKESILRHIEDQLEYFIEKKDLSTQEDLILRSEYRALVFLFSNEANKSIESQIKLENKKQNKILDQKKALARSVLIENLLREYQVSNLNEVLIKIAKARNSRETDIENLKLAVQLGADKETRAEENKTPLNLAVRNRNIELTKALLELNADIYALDSYTRTPLTLSVRNGDISIFKLLMPMIKDINENHGQLLSIATDRNLHGIIELLIENKADINIPRNNTPLHLATSFGNLETVKLLIKLGADINAKNIIGDSLLHTAIAKGSPEIVKILIDNNIDMKLKNNDGYTALDLLLNTYYRNFDNEIIELFKARMPQP